MKTTMVFVHCDIKSYASHDGARSRIAPGSYFRPFFWLSLGSGDMDATMGADYWIDAYYEGKAA